MPLHQVGRPRKAVHLRSLPLLRQQGGEGEGRGGEGKKGKGEERKGGEGKKGSEGRGSEGEKGEGRGGRGGGCCELFVVVASTAVILFLTCDLCYNSLVTVM